MKKKVKKQKQPDLKILSKIFKKYPTIMAVYIFGSSASGKSHAESDLDLAIVPADNTLREKKLDILTDLARAGLCNVDLIFLDTNDIVLKYEAIRANYLIYHKKNFSRGAYYSQTIRKYLDFMPYLRVQRKAYKKRVLNGSA
jgi:predicted nucleotidyltransferase